MFTINSSQTRPVSYQTTSSVKIPDSYSYFYLNSEINIDENLNSSTIKIFSTLDKYYSGTYYLVFYFKNLSTTIQNVANEIRSKLDILNSDYSLSVNYFYNATDNESIFYLKSYLISNFIRYLYAYPYTMQFNFTFDDFYSAVFTKTLTFSLRINYPYSLDINYVMCKK